MCNRQRKYFIRRLTFNKIPEEKSLKHNLVTIRVGNPSNGIFRRAGGISKTETFDEHKTGVRKSAEADSSGLTEDVD